MAGGYQADYVGQDGLPEDCPQCTEHEATIAKLESRIDDLLTEANATDWNEEALEEKVEAALGVAKEMSDRLDAIREAGGWRR
jgi:hypothetical protein